MTTWYIAPTGSDATGNGTIGNPYLTVAKCHTVGANGDTVICADGTYREYAILISKTNWTIQAAIGATPTFVASHAYTSWSKTGGQTNVYEAAYTSGTNWATWNGATKLTSTASVAACDAATNSFFFDNPNDKLYVNIGGSAPTSIEAYDVSNANALVATGTGFTLTGITFRYQMQSVSIQAGSSTVSGCTFLNWVGFATSTTFGMLEITTGTTHNISNCTFTGISPKSIAIGAAAAANSVAVQNCTITNGYRGISLAGGTGHLIDICTVSGCSDDGIRCVGTGTISNCTCHDNAGVQINALTGGSVTISYCTVYNATATNSYGIGISAGSGFVIDHCTAHDGYRDGIWIANASATVSYCTIYNFGHSGIWLGSGSAGVNTCVVHHCAVYINTAIASGPTSAIYGFVCDPPAMTVSLYHCIAANLKISSLLTRAGFFLQQDGTVTVENCITIDNTLGFDAAAAFTPTLNCDYNCVYGCTTAYVDDWSAGAHDVAADPKFLDLANFDFHLLAGSPCIDAGIYVAGINDGYKGSAPDIGLYESMPTAKIGVFAAPFQGAFG